MQDHFKNIGIKTKRLYIKLDKKLKDNTISPQKYYISINEWHGPTICQIKIQEPKIKIIYKVKKSDCVLVESDFVVYNAGHDYYESFITKHKDIERVIPDIKKILHFRVKKSI